MGALEKAGRALDRLGFYSKALEEAKGASMKAGTAQQWMNALQKQGVKGAEFKATGFADMVAADPNKRFTKDEIVDYLTKNRVKLDERVYTPDGGADGESVSEYDAWTLPGGKGYRENVLSLPLDEKVAGREFQFTHPDPYTRDVWLRGGSGDAPSPALIESIAARGYAPTGQSVDYTVPDKPRFTSDHHGDANPLLHQRFKTRLGPNGERVLHMEELQSDWAQQGRDVGFRRIGDDPQRLVREAQNAVADVMRERAAYLDELFAGDPTYASLREHDRLSYALNPKNRERLGSEFDAFNDRIFSAEQAVNAAHEQALKAKRMPPEAPFVTDTKDWTELGLKKALLDANKGGYDAIAWTPGLEQANRYGLRQYFDRLEYGGGTLRGYTKNDAGGSSAYPSIVETVGPDELHRFIGKEAAEKLLAVPETTIPGTKHGIRVLDNADLEVGGDGMVKYYDKIVPERLMSLVKRLDPEAGIESMPVGRPLRAEYSPDVNVPSRVFDRDTGEVVAEYPTISAASRHYQTQHWPQARDAPQLPMLKLTDKMKEELSKGLPLFVASPLAMAATLPGVETDQGFAEGGAVEGALKAVERADAARYSEGGPVRDATGAIVGNPPEWSAEQPGGLRQIWEALKIIGSNPSGAASAIAEALGPSVLEHTASPSKLASDALYLKYMFSNHPVLLGSQVMEPTEANAEEPDYVKQQVEAQKKADRHRLRMPRGYEEGGPVDLDTYFGNLENEFSLPAGFLARLRQIESGGGRNVYHPGSKAAGDFQIIPRTAKAWGVKDPYDTYEAARATAENAAKHRDFLIRNGIENVGGGHLFLAHNQGMEGARRLLTSPEALAASLVDPRAVTANRGKEGMTADAFARHIMGMYDGVKPGAQVPSTGARPEGGAPSEGMSPAQYSAMKVALGADDQQAKDTAMFKAMTGMQGDVNADPLAPMKAHMRAAAEASKRSVVADPDDLKNQIRQFVAAMSSKGRG